MPTKQHLNQITSLDAKRHSLAHLLAAAVLKLWPDSKRTIGPTIDNGFYYDFDFINHITEKDLPKIEVEMRKILSSWNEFKCIEVTPEESKKFFNDNPYKLELIEEFQRLGQKLTHYQSGSFIDLCRGGHVNKMSDIAPDSWKLDRLAGAYWRGNEKNKMLTRIYGLAFNTKNELEEYLIKREEAKKRDHKILGPALDLFTFSDLVGSGLPLWTPKGTLLRHLLDQFVWELRQAHGYERVEIPHITKKDLYERSGHWQKFQNELFKITTREGHLFALKPMNCPHHTQIYKRRKWSYRDLPQRYANTTMVYRDEQSGELAGLSRVRAITQDDAHVFCRRNQASEEALKIWDIIEKFYNTAGFRLDIRLSLHDATHPEKYLGTPEVWQDAEEQLRAVIKNRGVSATEAIGEAAFYGPKIDFLAKDSLDREWQVATIQLDMNLPERFDLTCTNEKGQEEQIVMIHAAIMGSIERYLSILIEHFAGEFPLWLSPVQVKLLPISEKQKKYLDYVFKLLIDGGIRVEKGEADEPIGKRIRAAELEKIPYICVIGDSETSNKTLNVRGRCATEMKEIEVEKFIKIVTQKNVTREL